MDEQNVYYLPLYFESLAFYHKNSLDWKLKLKEIGITLGKSNSFTVSGL